MFWLYLLLIVILLIAVLLNGLAVWRARCFIKKQAADEKYGMQKPPVTLMVPICGTEGDDLEHFSRFCRLDWPNYQVIFTVLDPADPVIPILQQIPSSARCEVKLHIGGSAKGNNLKIRNLLNAMPWVRNDLIVICDADVKPEPHFLEGLIAPLMNPFLQHSQNSKEDSKIGLVHSLYRCMADHNNMPTAWESVWINCDFWVHGLLGDWLRGTNYAFGAAIAIHRATLNQIGGLEAFADYLADDYQIGQRVWRLKKTIVFNQHFVTLRTKSQTWSETWKHLLRWSRTIRVCQPSGYAGSILLNVTFFAILGLLINFHYFLPWSLLALFLRAMMANQCHNWILDKHGFWGRWWLVFFKDLAQVVLWLLAFHNGTVEWRGVRHRLHSDGKLSPTP